MILLLRGMELAVYRGSMEQKQKKNRSRGFSLIELMFAIVIVGILASVAIPRIIGTQDRARISGAVRECEHFRKGLGIFEADHGFYPAEDRNNANGLTQDLVDEFGNAYMTLPDGSNFVEFSYHSISNGESYELRVTARDGVGTQILATPSQTVIGG